jgi:ribosomal protein S18 acetylase RimI-like enzyme
MNIEKIVELDPQDIEKCYCIWDIKGKQETLQTEMQQCKRKMFVYIKNEMIVGGGSIVWDNGDINRTSPFKRAYLSYLVVEEKFRNQGIGTKLIDYMSKYVIESGVTEITIYVEKSNPRAKELYLRKGFKEIVLEKADRTLLLKRLL